MTEAALRSADEITPAWLTEILRRNGVLGSARVADVRLESSRTTILSSIAMLRVSYTPAPPVSAPSRIFVKMTKDGLDVHTAQPVGRAEVGFYRTVAPAMIDPPVPRCYDAVFDEASNRFHLLLEVL